MANPSPFAASSQLGSFTLEIGNRLTRDHPPAGASARDARDVSRAKVSADLLEAEPELISRVGNRHRYLPERAGVHHLHVCGLDPMLGQPRRALENRLIAAIGASPQLGDIDGKLPYLSLEARNCGSAAAEICELQVQSLELALQRRRARAAADTASRAGSRFIRDSSSAAGSGLLHCQHHHSSDYKLVATLHTMLCLAATPGIITTC